MVMSGLGESVVATVGGSAHPPGCNVSARSMHGRQCRGGVCTHICELLGMRWLTG